MESLTTDELIGFLVMIGLVTFMLWLAPQAVGGKPFFLDLEEQDWYKKKKGY